MKLTAVKFCVKSVYYNFVAYTVYLYTRADSYVLFNQQRTLKINRVNPLK